LVFLLFRGKLTKHANHGMRQDAVQQSNYVLSPPAKVVRRAQDSRDRGSLEPDLLALPDGTQKKSGDGRRAGHDGDIYTARRDFTASCPPSTHSPCLVVPVCSPQLRHPSCHRPSTRLCPSYLPTTNGRHCAPSSLVEPAAHASPASPRG
jgi:hypothetical protein